MMNEENKNTFGPRSFKTFVSEPTLFDEWFYKRNEIEKQKEKINIRIKRYREKLEKIKGNKGKKNKKIYDNETVIKLQEKLVKAQKEHNNLEQKITNINKQMYKQKPKVKYQKVLFKKNLQNQNKN